VTAAEPENIPLREPIDDFAAFGISAFVTTRAAGDFALAEPEPEPAALGRWHELQRELSAYAPPVPRLVSAKQVHGTKMFEHTDSWTGWLRAGNGDGHFAGARGTAMAVTVADCVPVFVGHPSGAAALLHAGWRGTAAGFVSKALSRLRELGFEPQDLIAYLGPAICGRCYEVSPDVFEQLTGWQTIRHRHVDLRALLAEQAKEAGVRKVGASPYCTRCDNDRFFSHRAGDSGRQIGAIFAP
jgi:hypothetical protein